MVVIVDSGSANISSVKFALRRLGYRARVTNEAWQIQQADKVIFPGVGSAVHAMRVLRQKNLINCIRGLSQPMLGICLGMQLLYECSAEGAATCLGVIPGKIEPLPHKPGLTIPHMGWNRIKRVALTDRILEGVEDESLCYFVHSYYAPVSQYTVATAEYGVTLSAVVKRDNFYGCQFHPEKSSATGATILKNFLGL